MENTIKKLIRTIETKESVKEVTAEIFEQPMASIDTNLIQLMIIALDCEELRHLIAKKCTNCMFYCKARHILSALSSNILAMKQDPRPIIVDFENLIDSEFVNIVQATEDTDWEQFARQKQSRSDFIENRGLLFKSIRTLSEQLKLLRDKQVEGQTLFSSSLEHINQFLKEKYENKDDLECGMLVHRGNKAVIRHILQQGSKYLQTKNRAPLLLNLQFSRFIFKVDNLLQNELIAKEITQFLQLRLPFIRFVAFDIIPLPHGGALYDFMEHSYTVSDAKKKTDGTLKTYYSNSKQEQQKLLNFTLSLVGFSIQQYVLQLKDRHNENIMIDGWGHILHIDLSYIFGSKLPWGLETVPFKLTKEYVQLMGGFDSDNFQLFQSQLVKAFAVLSTHIDALMLKLEIFKKMPELKCFENFNLQAYRKTLPSPTDNIKKFVQKIISESYDSWRTRKYDSFQYKANGIFV